MSGFGVFLSDPALQGQFTQVELRGHQSKFLAMAKDKRHVLVKELPPLLVKLKGLNHGTEQQISDILHESHPDRNEEIDFESFLRVYLELQRKVTARPGMLKHSSSFMKSSTTTLLHTINEAERASYISHINSYLGEDKFLKNYLPLDPHSNALFDLTRDGVLLCKLINVAVPGTIDERAINTKKKLNPWERNENHTLCLNSAKAIGCTVVNIGTQDLIEGRPHLVLGLISQIIKIQLLADLNLKNTPQLVELIEEDSKEKVEELSTLAPEKMLLKWMNFHLKKAGYKKTVTNFSADVKDGEAYAYLLHALAPEHCTSETLDLKDPAERAKVVLEEAGKLECKRHLSAKDIVEGSPNLNLAFVAQIFQHRNGLSNEKAQEVSEMPDDENVSREERAFRMWINSLGIATYVNHLFEDVRNGWVLLEVLDKVSPGAVKWKQASKPPIQMPFRKVENCNQVIKLGKELNLSLINVCGNDIVQGNKKLIVAFLWQLMRFNMLQLLKNLRSHSQGKEITDADILNWANNKVKESGKTSQMESFKDKHLSNGIFFLELLTAVKESVVDWNLVTKGEDEEQKKMNATYIISVARKLGCSVYLLPEDIIEVNPKMILALSASIMYWSLKQPGAIPECGEASAEASVVSAGVGSIPTIAEGEGEEEKTIAEGEEENTIAEGEEEKVIAEGEEEETVAEDEVEKTITEGEEEEAIAEGEEEKTVSEEEKVIAEGEEEKTAAEGEGEKENNVE